MSYIDKIYLYNMTIKREDYSLSFYSQTRCFFIYDIFEL